ncbi:hypothetical protein ACTL6P_18210 [Endozoicomonas acroporae]|uniref:hypothetical protein n=1 Tax=Endozoicomonas acroporae TaxID=1701104 RepID=UPI000C75A514|nr:hypothetical protein [Endozoicomonas acroporae]
MKARLQSVIVSLGLISTVALADELPLWSEMISDTEIKALQTEAMEQIEQELMKELPADLARHHQLINEHLFDQQPLNETVQQNDNNSHLNKKKDENRIINFLNINPNQGAQS